MAYDDASNAIYASDWVHGQNGGFGFGPWALTPEVENTGIVGAFVGTSANNGDDPLKGSIDVGGRAWSLYANVSGSISGAVRQFTPGGVTGDSTLGIGEQFIIKLDNGLVAAGGAVGFGLQNSDGQNRFEFYYGSGQSGYTLNIENDLITLHGVTYAGMTVRFTLTGTDTFNLEINYALGTPSTETFSGTLDGPMGTGIDRFRLFNFAASANNTPRSNPYFNSAQVIPEPSSLVFLAAGVFAAARRRRK